jgi:pyruvate carboxylase subunit B
MLSLRPAADVPAGSCGRTSPDVTVAVLAEPGDSAHARQAVVVTEAMKMDTELHASRDGREIGIAVRDGQSVHAGARLAVIADG